MYRSIKIVIDSFLLCESMLETRDVIMRDKFAILCERILEWVFVVPGFVDF